MSFWRYFKGKLLGISYLFIGTAIIVGGAYLIITFGIGNDVLGQINLETACCAVGGLIIAAGAFVIAYGQRKLQKLDES